MTLLYAAHRVVEQLTLDRDLVHLRDRLAPEVAEMVYYGFWYSRNSTPDAFIREAQKPVNGEVSLNLYKGNIIVAGRHSPNSLYDEGIATMEGGGSYNQPTPRDSSASRACPAAFKAARGRGLLRGLSAVVLLTLRVRSS